MAQQDGDERTRRVIEQLLRLEAHGAEVWTVAADVTDRAQMQAALDGARERFGAIHGVIHAAGVPGAGLIQLKRLEDAARVLAPKVQGTLVLDALCRDLPLDFLVLFSSSIAVTGGLGEVDYCAANAFLDAFARYRSDDPAHPTISIAWGPWQWDAWQETLAAALPAMQDWFRQMRATYGISFAEGVEAFRRILADDLAQVVVLPQDLREAMRGFTPGFLAELQQAQARQTAHPRPNLMTPYMPPRNEVELRVAAIWQEVLGIDQIGIYDNFLALGGHSLVAIQIVARLKKEFGIQLSATSLFEGPTISALAEIVRRDPDETPVFEQSSDRGRKRKERQKQLAGRVLRQLD